MRTEIKINGRVQSVDTTGARLIELGQDYFLLEHNGVSYPMQIRETANGWRIMKGGIIHMIEVEQMGRRPQKREVVTPAVLAPMPGVVTESLVESGQSVEMGQPLLRMESMKMQMNINSPRSGRVDFVALPGTMVKKGSRLALVV